MEHSNCYHAAKLIERYLRRKEGGLDKATVRAKTLAAYMKKLVEEAELVAKEIEYIAATAGGVRSVLEQVLEEEDREDGRSEDV